MAKKATKDQKAQVETLSYIDSLITILGDYPEATLPLSMNISPFGFLVDICKSLGIYDELLVFIAKIIQYEMPTIELGIKGILLANIKNQISCSQDPFIPSSLRKNINSTEDNGITFSISDIDYNGLMSINPISLGSEYSYFGIDRTYDVKYKIYQKYSAVTAANYTANKYYSNKEDALAWIDKKIAKAKNKFKENNKVSYKINSGDTIEQFSAVTKTITGKDVIKYKPVVTVECISKTSLNTVVVNGVDKPFSYYEEAKKYLNKLEKKYKKQYPSSEGYFTDKNIQLKCSTSLYELARAKDFNAFLWFAIHMADFNNATNLSLTNSSNWKQGWKDDVKNKFNKINLTFVENSGDEPKGPLGVLKANGSTTNASPSLLGSSFNLTDKTSSALYDLCIKSTASNNANTYTIVPASSDIKSLNWYGDRSKYFDFLKYYGNPKKESEESPRIYGNEIGICNIEFDTIINDTNQLQNFNRNKVRFTALPKPLVFFKGTVFKKILFDAEGNFNSKGKYSVFVTKDSTTGKEKYVADKRTFGGVEYRGYYTLTTKNDTTSGLGKMYIPYNWSEEVYVDFNGTTGNSVPYSCLYECYPNLTIYEFNYDYVMSQRLFDAKVLVAELIQSILNCKLGGSGNLKLGGSGNVSLSITHNIIEGTLREVVLEMVSGGTNTYTSNDCYTAFSNEKYEQLQEQAELKQSQGYKFESNGRVTSLDTEKINSILSEYDNPDISQEGKVDVITRAFSTMSATITEGTEDSESWDVKFDIITQLINDLVFSIVKSILTPKIIMLLYVNKKLMDDDTEWLGNISENLMTILIGIISDIVKQIVNMMLERLLTFVLDFLKPKFEELSALIMKEYTEQYRDLIEALITACGSGWGSGAATADTQIDKVTYADIDPTEEVTQDGEC